MENIKAKLFDMNKRNEKKFFIENDFYCIVELTKYGQYIVAKCSKLSSIANN